MSFEDDLKEVIQGALEENQRERQTADAFRNGWDTLRETVVLRVLRAAQYVLQGESLRWNAAADLTNGSGVELRVVKKLRTGLSDSSYAEYTLSFAQTGKLQVVCSSTLKGWENEVYDDLVTLTEDAVEAKVKRFVAGIIREKKGSS